MSRVVASGDNDAMSLHCTKPVHSSQENSSSASEEAVQRSVRKNGRFINPWPTFKLPGLGSVLKWSLFSKDNSQIPTKQELDETLPVLKPDLELLNTAPPADAIRSTWIGHATVLVQMEDCNILTDPVFSSRCSPVQFAGPKRYRHVPCTVHDLPRIDAVVISHTHYDHLDLPTVQAINARFGADVRWFVPLGLATWMHSNGCDNVIELDWWDENCIPEYPSIRFVFTPAQHWCKRTPVDDNKVLWGSWCIIGTKSRFFFCGDTGYCSVFEQVGKRYGPFDLAAIPIGAYDPRWFMRPQHIDPAEAVQVHKDLQASISIAIHWGTFNLSNEHYLEPPEKLREAAAAAQLEEDTFLVLQHGETRLLTTHHSHSTDNT